MTPVDAIQRLDALNIDLGFAGSGLVLSGDTSALPPAFREALKASKPSLLEEIAKLRPEPARHYGSARNCRFYLASHGQQRLAFIDALHPGSSAYIVAASIFFRGQVDAARLIHALTTVAARHDAVYTYLVRTEQGDLSAIDHNLPITLQTLDLSDHPAPERELERLRQTISTTPFDLTHPPLWRWTLVRTANDSYELIVAIHHYICDGWSLAAAFRQIAHAYREGDLPADRAAGASYQHFARYQRARLLAPDVPDALAAARAALADCQLASESFDGEPRPALHSDESGRRTFSLSPGLSRQLRALAARLSVTIGSVLAAAFALTIHRFTRDTRFAIGIAASHRPQARFESTFGFFVNWLAVPVNCGQHCTFAEFLKRFHGEKLSAVDRVFIPFEEIAKMSGAARAPFLHPVFQYMFVSHVPARRVAMPNLEVTLRPLPNGAAKLDLTMFLTDSRDAVAVEGEGDLFLELEYNAGLFGDATIDRFLGTFQGICSIAGDAPDRSVSALLAGPPSIVHGPVRQHPETLLALFDTAADNHADRVALECAGERWTYQTLRMRAAQIAAELSSENLSGRTIAILATRGGDLIAALLGVMAAGATFATLDPIAPRERNRRICADLRPALILHSPSLADDAAWLESGAATAVLDTFGGLSGNDATLARIPVQPTDPAYVLYTSGSTGTPKGVVIPHGALANFVAWMNETLASTAEDRVLAKTPISFDAFLRETLAALCSGARVVLVPDGECLDIDTLVSTIAARGVTIVHATPTIYAALLDVAADQPDRPLRTLRRVMCGGEALTPALAARHFAMLPECRLFNVYGPTECTVDVTGHEIGPADHGKIPLGRPIDNCSIAITDAALEPVEQGDVGEIVVAGTPVGLGYHGAPPGADSPFLRDISWAPGKAAYRTGDRGRLLANGEVEYRGRADRQIKIRGMRVEPAEIEAVIEQHPAVARAALLPLTAPDGEPQLSAAVQLRSACDDRDFAGTLLAYLADRVPPAMLPHRVVRLDGFPSTLHGKLDGKALARMVQAAVDLDDGGVSAPRLDDQPRSPVEAEIMAFASVLLDRTDIGRDDNFFALGGHSLSAIRLLNQVNKRFGTTLAVKALFADPTVAALAAAVSASAQDGSTTPATIQPIRRSRRISAD
ncbi:amino acid adenylation domain-containing protein [uncultured Sphingomonas sp.]|uniref:non-ribosomal peptide synthetase n=1 Tax=uncultured Sphingomonas sp. TaxID=158754 RepID=UPI0025F479D7|nr:amino acid adenylation domain-containing protein [uncultured Sphingomonas sp.]